MAGGADQGPYLVAKIDMIELKGALRTILLLSGVLGPILYLSTDLVAVSLRQGYSPASQSISELSAPGTPTRTFVVLLDLLVCALVCAFGVAVWIASAGSIPLRLMAGIFVGGALLQALALVFFPYHPGEAANSPSNSLNVAIMAPSIAGWFAAIGLGIVAFQNWFRGFSIGLLSAFFVAAVLATVGIGLLLPSGHPGPAVGLQERTTAYGFYLWMALLAEVLY